MQTGKHMRWIRAIHADVQDRTTQTDDDDVGVLFSEQQKQKQEQEQTQEQHATHIVDTWHGLTARCETPDRVYRNALYDDVDDPRTPIRIAADHRSSYSGTPIRSPRRSRGAVKKKSSILRRIAARSLERRISKQQQPRERSRLDILLIFLLVFFLSIRSIPPHDDIPRVRGFDAFQQYPMCAWDDPHPHPLMLTDASVAHDMNARGGPSKEGVVDTISGILAMHLGWWRDDRRF